MAYMIFIDPSHRTRAGNGAFSRASFDTISVTKKDFDFRSFVKRVSKENTSMPKYIRDNWTIVVSIRNQLENDK